MFQHVLDELEIHRGGRAFLVQAVPLEALDDTNIEFACRIIEYIDGNEVLANREDIEDDILVFDTSDEAHEHGFAWIKEHAERTIRPKR
jgi:hypothetical protein